MDSPVDEIKSRLDIAEVIQEYVQLKKSGQNYKALCPFHNEKTPSFFVSPDKQIWHCFGCGEGGDIFGFIMKIEGIEFPEALRLLAKKAGVQLRRQDPNLQSKRNRLYEMCSLAAKYFHKVLLDSKSAAFVRDYLKSRNLTDDIVEKFLIGYAPDSWDMLSRFLKKKGYSDQEIFEAGFTVKKQKENSIPVSRQEYYDRFRNRLMFPILDVHGNVVGFGGRAMEDVRFKKNGKSTEISIAKYINTPQSLIYDKSRILYGIDKAKQEIRKQNLAIIVEGYTDMISSYKAGVKNVVSASGTALTFQQVNLIKRYTNNVALAFDMDIAGDSATQRGIDIAIQAGLNVKVVRIPAEKDPDDIIRENPKIWRDAIKNAISIMDFYFSKALDNKNLEDVEIKKEVANQLLSVIKKVPNKIEQAHYIQLLSKRLNVDEKILSDQLSYIKIEPTYNSFLDSKKSEKNVFGNKSEIEVVGGRILGIAFKFSDNVEYILKNIDDDYLEGDLLTLYKELECFYNNNKSFNYTEFRKKLKDKSEDLAQKADVLVLDVERNSEYSEDDDIILEDIKNCIKRLKKIYLKNKLQEISTEISRAESSGDLEKIEDLSNQFNEITKKLRET